LQTNLVKTLDYYTTRKQLGEERRLKSNYMYSLLEKPYLQHYYTWNEWSKPRFTFSWRWDVPHQELSASTNIIRVHDGKVSLSDPCQGNAEKQKSISAEMELAAATITDGDTKIDVLAMLQYLQKRITRESCLSSFFELIPYFQYIKNVILDTENAKLQYAYFDEDDDTIINELGLSDKVFKLIN